MPERQPTGLRGTTAPRSIAVLKQFFVRRWFLLSLAIVFIMGVWQSSRLAPLAEAKTLRSCLVALILFMMSFPLEFGSMWRVIRRPWAALLAVGVNLGLLPLMAWGIYVSPFLSGEFANGLMVAAATPSTMASASVWTRRAGGNDAVSILVTIITNMTCFVVTPLWLVATTGRDVNITLSDMIQKLGLLVFLPIVAGQLIRLYRPVGCWATRHKTALGVAAQCGLLVMILIGAIQSGNALSNNSTNGSLLTWSFAAMLVSVMAVHLSMLWAGHALGRAAGINRADRIAIGFSGSQKTLAVGLYVSTTYYPGLTLLTMVTYHIGQLLVDTIIADRLRQAGPDPPPGGGPGKAPSRGP